MAPEQRPPHANLADYARKLQAEHDAEYLAKWEVIKTLSEALDQGFAKIPKGEYHVRKSPMAAALPDVYGAIPAPGLTIRLKDVSLPIIEDRKDKEMTEALVQTGDIGTPADNLGRP
ncbi:hypothetical protein B0H67DRAFT_677556 [Lasiosphaeris hirsuta]|uniref:Uncharacterized protein n=1 Tax=Lasiosphaeris hirsuta TaxID=260670 RepID=A0AA40E608_9PEZI|nr:hypothetical protein B0H67DRAFT_677556 [Lasiosphaeris hirsuta]